MVCVLQTDGVLCEIRSEAEDRVEHRDVDFEKGHLRGIDFKSPSVIAIMIDFKSVAKILGDFIFCESCVVIHIREEDQQDKHFSLTNCITKFILNIFRTSNCLSGSYPKI